VSNLTRGGGEERSSPGSSAPTQISSPLSLSLHLSWSHKQEQEDRSGTTPQECLLIFFKTGLGFVVEGLVPKQGRFELGKRQAKKIKRREDGWVLIGDSGHEPERLLHLVLVDHAKLRGC